MLITYECSINQMEARSYNLSDKKKLKINYK